MRIQVAVRDIRAEACAITCAAALTLLCAALASAVAREATAGLLALGAPAAMQHTSNFICEYSCTTG
jgi:hypothetical protein